MTHQRIQVGPIDVHLTPSVVDQSTQFADRCFEHPVCRRVGDHDCRKPIADFSNFESYVVEVNVASNIACNDLDVEASHHSTCRIGPVRTRGNQADGALLVAIAPVESTNGEQTGKLALAPRVRLQAHGVVAGDRCKPTSQIVNHRPIPGNLRSGSERMDFSKLRPRDRQHLRRGIQLHCAGSERDHRTVQRQVAIAETSQVSKHFMFGVISLEHRLRQEFIRATQCSGKPIGSIIERSLN